MTPVAAGTRGKPIDRWPWMTRRMQAPHIAWFACGVTRPYRKDLDHPDEHVEIAGVIEDLVEIGDFTVGRVVHPPGWRWSKDMRPVVGGEWCMARHVGVVLSGSMTVYLKDGTVIPIGPNQVFDIPPGHDAEVSGNGPLVELDWSGLEAWTGHRIPLGDRVLAGLLMTDIVGSTPELTRRGDAGWRRALGEHRELLRSQLDRFRGREVDTAGDSMFAVFDGAARALQCAAALRQAARQQGLPIRAGVHVGEVEMTDNDVRGIAVHEVARIMAAAEESEVLVSEATKALVTGAGLVFEDRGLHSLKGLDGPRRLYAYQGRS